MSASRFFAGGARMAAGKARYLSTSPGGTDYSVLIKRGVFATGVIASSGYLLMTAGQHDGGTKIFGTDSDSTTSFQVMTALEMKDEVQKVRLAQILHELHEIAREQGLEPQRRNNVAQSAWKFVSKPFTGTPDSDLISEDGAISLRGVKASRLKPKKAQALIDALLEGGRFDGESLLQLLEASEKSLKKDPSLIDLRKSSKNVTVVGDLHGSLNSLANVLELIGDIGGANGSTVIFDGDFVDRGTESLEVLCILLLLKLAYPRDVYLLRGNHEDVLVSAAYGFKEEVVGKYGADASFDIWDKFGEVFCALPICAVTKSAAILHGGLPSERFSLSDVQAIDTATRCKIRTTVETKTETDRLVKDILWSDPSNNAGIHPNTTRSVGVQFGPDVAKDFLERHNLLYLIRAHEVVEDGTSVLDCGDGRSVITVFSQAAYPNGQGTNLGAIVKLDKDGGCDRVDFSSEASQKDGQKEDPYVKKLTTVIANNKNQLELHFKSAASDDFVTAEQWEKIMAETLELPDAPWGVLRKSLAAGKPFSKKVNWREFLAKYSSADDDSDSSMDGRSKEILQANHKMLLTVYKFLDVDGNGTLDMQEFKTGIDLLNKRLPEDQRLGDAEELFHAIDVDSSGTIDLDEFEKAFSVV